MINPNIYIATTAKIWQPTTILTADRTINIEADCRIGQYCFIAPKKLIMVRGAEICPTAVLGGGGNIHLGEYSTVDYGAKLIPATFTTKGKYMNDAMMKKNPENIEIIRGSITLKDGAVVASNAVVCVSRDCPDIVIGENSVVGALSYLDKSLEDNVVYVKGEIKKRD